MIGSIVCEPALWFDEVLRFGLREILWMFSSYADAFNSLSVFLLSILNLLQLEMQCLSKKES